MCSTPVSPTIGRDALLHELQVHQIELEQQNDELRRTQSELALAHDLYHDLYEWAPVGYCTLDERGSIVQINLTGASLLGQPRSALLGAPLTRFVAPEDADRWQLHLRQALGVGAVQRIELTMVVADGSLQWLASLESACIAQGGARPQLRVALSDVTERHRAAVERRIARIDADAREQERQRLALALHEDLGQRLSVLKMRLTRLFERDPAPASAGERAALLAELDHAVAAVREITGELRPPMLDDLGLDAAVEWLVRATADRLGLTLSLHVEAGRPPGRSVSIALYRFLQEALSSLLKGADARALRVEIRRPAGRIVLHLHLSGGSPHARPIDGSFESATLLAHRARMLGGQLALDARADAEGWQGLTLTLDLHPVDASDHGPGRTT